MRNADSAHFLSSRKEERRSDEVKMVQELRCERCACSSTSTSPSASSASVGVRWMALDLVLSLIVAVGVVAVWYVVAAAWVKKDEEWKKGKRMGSTWER